MSPATYTFSKALSFSSDHTAGCLVATIPVIAVGFLGLAIATFLFIVRKLDFALGLVCGSAFLEFLAALFDVSEILVRGAADDGVSSTTVTSLMLARDIFFSFAGGLRFFAFWTIVALRPRGEAPATQPKTSESILVLDPSMHSGSWMRWGVMGIILKWLTAAIAVAITLMQILWRAVNEFDNLGSVYAAENALEVVMSVIFIIKLCLNAAITDTPSRSRWMTLMDYTPLFVALLFNFALGVGNIAVFPFSESTAGRLMIATELYIVLETLLCWKFYDTARPQATPNEKTDPILNATAPPYHNPSDSTFLMAPQRPSPLDRLSDSGQRISAWVQQPRPSWTQRLSSLSGRFRPALARDEARLYNPQDAERGQSPTTTENGATVTYDLSPSEARQSARYPDPMYTSFFQDSQRDVGAFNQGQTRAGSVSDSGLGSHKHSSISSFDGRETDGQSLIVPPPIAVSSGSASISSPIYGLNGTIRAGGFSPAMTAATFSPMMRTLDTAPPPSFVDFVESPTSLEPPRPTRDDTSSARSSGYNQLLREQDELEKSIAQLRLLSTSQALDSVIMEGFSYSPDSGLSREQSNSSGSGSGPLKSASLRSEFSLSVFPEPPLARRSSQVRPQALEEYADNASTIVPTRHRDHGRQDSNDSRIDVDIERATMDFRDARLNFRDSAIDLPPPRMPALSDELIQTVPSSTRTSEDHSEYQPPQSRLDSNGTQYDVTSFIGTLTVPSYKKANSTLSVITNARKPQADEESDTTSPAPSTLSAQIVAVERRPSDAQAARVIRLDSNGSKDLRTSVPAVPAAPRTITIPPRSQSADDVDGSLNSSAESPNGRTSPTSSGRQVEFGRTPSGRKAGLPARPRMVNSTATIEEEIAPEHMRASPVQPPF